MAGKSKDKSHNTAAISRDLFTKWRWRNHPLMVATLCRLIIMANHKDNDFENVKIKRGQRVVGLKKLSEDVGCTMQQIRTILTRLEASDTIARKSTNKFSIITLLKYNEYQPITNGKITNEQQTNNKQITTNNNENNDNKEKKSTVRQHNGLYKKVIEYLNTTCNKRFSPNSDPTVKLINGRISDGFTENDILAVIDHKSAEWLGSDKMDRYLRPKTLFAKTNFENYLNEAPLHEDAKIIDWGE